jgi:hypothetical protein
MMYFESMKAWNKEYLDRWEACNDKDSFEWPENGTVFIIKHEESAKQALPEHWTVEIAGRKSIGIFWEQVDAEAVAHLYEEEILPLGETYEPLKLYYCPSTPMTQCEMAEQCEVVSQFLEAGIDEVREDDEWEC